jgi:hypothetical protein
MARLSALEGRRVRDEDGRQLGHVWDLRTPARDAEPAAGLHRTVAWLLVGRRGLLERLGFKREAANRIAWQDVLAIEPHEIVVRKGALQARPGSPR